jgi:hypothetical protein
MQLSSYKLAGFHHQVVGAAIGLHSQELVVTVQSNGVFVYNVR